MKEQDLSKDLFKLPTCEGMEAMNTEATIKACWRKAYTP